LPTLQQVLQPLLLGERPVATGETVRVARPIIAAGDADTCRHLDEQGLASHRLLEHVLNGSLAFSLRAKAAARDSPPRNCPYPVVGRPPDTPRAIRIRRGRDGEGEEHDEQAGTPERHAPPRAAASPTLGNRVRNPARGNDEGVIHGLYIRPKLPGLGADDPHHPFAKLGRWNFTCHLDRYLRAAPAGDTRIWGDMQPVEQGFTGDSVRKLRL